MPERERPVGGASEKAVEAVFKVIQEHALRGRTIAPETVADALAAAHDPVLGLDRSVCLRDVVKALPLLGERKHCGDQEPLAYGEGWDDAVDDLADAIERHFTEADYHGE